MQLWDLNLDVMRKLGVKFSPSCELEVTFLL